MPYCCRLKMRSTIELHLLKRAPGLLTGLPRQVQVVLSQEERVGGQDILVATSSSQWLSGWLMSVVTYCTSAVPFSRKNSFQPTTNLSYLTRLCNTRLAFIVLAGKKKNLPFVPHSPLILKPHCPSFFSCHFYFFHFESHTSKHSTCSATEATNRLSI